MRSQTAEIYEVIRNKITSGEYKPSESLTETALSTQYGVSRNTIKKVLLMLVQENLVTLEANKSAKVRSYSLDEVVEFLELRAALEGLIIRKATENITDIEIKKLEDIVSKMRTFKEKHDLLSYSDCNREFHMVIYGACKNRTVVDMALQLKMRMSKYNSKTILVPGRDEQSFKEHSAILEAMKARDAKKADALMQKHMESVRNTFEKNYSLLF